MASKRITQADLPSTIQLLPPEKPAGGHRKSNSKAPAAAEFPWAKIAFIGLLMLLYAGSPLDLIPDFIPVIGWMDDLLVEAGLLGMIGRTVLKFYSAKRAFLPTPKNLLRRLMGRWLLKRATAK